MRRVTLWLVSTIAALVLLFSYKTSTQSGVPPVTTVAGGGATTATDNSATTGSGSGSTGGSGSGSSGGSSGGSGSGGSSSSGSGSSGSTRATTVDGSVVQTRWGPVQVRISVSGGKITNVTMLQVPDSNRRDQMINDYAVPVLVSATLAAQSANVDTVSGATVTSDGYRESLQAAIDAAHL